MTLSNTNVCYASVLSSVSYYGTTSTLVFQINYKADSNQIGFLQLLSVRATQNVTYHCRNSVAYFDLEHKTYRRGVKLLGWNDAEITPRGNNKFRYTVEEDECRVSTVQLGERAVNGVVRGWQH